MRVLVAGATGMIAGEAIAKLLAAGHKVVALSRDPAKRSWPAGVEPLAWDAKSAPAVPGRVDAVVHLAGESVGARWTAERMERMRESRVGVADHLVDWMAAQPAAQRPKAFVCASAVGYYGQAAKGPQAEEAPPGDDFLALLVRDWEDAARHAEMLDARVVLLRFAVVLHPSGGALGRMLLPFRLGLGGPLGAGTQPFPWVHLDDAASTVAWAVESDAASGAYNVAAPQQTDMRGFAKSLAAALHRPALLRVPAFALRAGLGKGAASVVLGGQEAPPDRILRAGFRFRHPDLGPALRSMLA